MEDIERLELGSLLGDYATPLRDWFAGMALQGILKDYLDSNNVDHMNCTAYAEEAYEIADAMMKARER